jgi:hypothetical protein
MITGNITSSDDSFPVDIFFVNIDNLFGDTGDNVDANAAAPAAQFALYGSYSPLLDLARVSSSHNRCYQFMLFRCNMFIYSINLHD